MIKTDVLILGGGLAGLSAAYHLERQGCGSLLVVEKGESPGGLAGSIAHRGFTFDYTGHLLHLHSPYTKDLILRRLLKGKFLVHNRSAWIHSHGWLTRYPFQANTYGLPEDVVDECVTGFLKTVHRPAAAGGPARGARESFLDFCLARFGEGISKHFMIPYNEKLWRRPLSELTTEWQGRFVPKPAASEVLLGALSDQKTGFGYNASFYYPRSGGIQALPDALAGCLKPGRLLLNSPVTEVDLKSRTARVQGLGPVRYERLVNTLPLTDFIDLSAGLPASTRRARKRLRYNSVYCLNLGVGRPLGEGRHWIYFPEKRFPFYRVGFYTSFSAASAPPGASSLYVEHSRRGDEPVSLARLEKAALRALRGALLRPKDEILAKLWVKIPCAYVVYDFERAPALEAIFSLFKKKGVESIGRYGAWKYSFMEEAVLDGKACAERLHTA